MSILSFECDVFKEQCHTKKCGESSIFNINIDIGNVACKSGEDYEDEECNIEYKSIFMEGFLENIKKLKQDGHQLFFNSFCGSKREAKVREEFKKNPEIFNIIPESNWNFVRNPKKKYEVCIKTSANIMIDDKLNICNNIKEHGINYVLWFNKSTDTPPNGIINVKSWSDIYIEIKKLQI